jgi:lysophospholipase L1-like esterase
MLGMGVYAQRLSVSVLGDSYSTFEGFMTPASNELWYYCKTRDNTDVTEVTQTWWWQTIKENGWKLDTNNSYSGATIGYSGYSGNDYSARSFITRMDNIGNPDIIFIFGGTNDSWAGEKVGEYKWAEWNYGDFYTYRPAMAYLLNYLQLHHPNVAIYFIINDGLREDITESSKVICDHYGVPYIMLKDIDKQNGHPTIKGMRQIADQVSAAVKR